MHVRCLAHSWNSTDIIYFLLVLSLMMHFNNIYFVMKEFPQLEFKIINVSRGFFLRRPKGGLDVSVL